MLRGISTSGGSGPSGQGVPSGGATGQVLTKNSNSDNDLIWSTPSGGTSFPGLSIDSVSSGIGRFFTSQARSSSISPQALSPFVIRYTPILVLASITVNSLAINVTSALSGLARCGVYSMSNGYMGSQLATSADIDVSTTGFKVYNLLTPLVLTPGWYFTPVVSNVAVTLSSYTSSTPNISGGNPLGFVANSVTAIDFREENNGSSIILPATASQSTTTRSVGAIHAPMVFLGL